MIGRPTIKIINPYSDEVVECYVNVGNYPASKLAMYIQLVDKADDVEYGVCSVNLGNYSSELSFVQLNSTFMDTNNWTDEMLKPVYEALGAKPYVRFGSPVMGHSGYCDYPLYEFDSDKLREFDSKGYDEYVKTWQKECVVEQQKMNQRMFGVAFGNS